MFYIVFLYFNNFFIYKTSGLFSVLSIIIWTINLFISTLILIQNSQNIWIRICQLISIFVLIYLIFLNISILFDIYKLAVIIPLSINKIIFLEDWFKETQNNIFFIKDPKIGIIHFGDPKEIALFLETLDKGKAYVTTFELTLSWNSYEKGDPSIYISNPILFSRDSNAKLISLFLYERIISGCYLYNLEETQFIESVDKPGVLISYKEINLF